jgi:hypothetical protein
MINDSMNLTFRGLLEVLDENGKVLVRQNNQIHPENISLAVAQSLSNKSIGPIEKMVFGSGGSVVNGVGNITYLSKNVIGSNSLLYNQTYDKIVDDNNIQNVDPTRNNIQVFHVDGNIFSDIMVTCTLELSEPSGQRFLDNAPTAEEDFVFDEIGLMSYSGKLLSHVIFSPVQKSANRIIVVRYTIRVQVC